MEEEKKEIESFDEDEKKETQVEDPKKSEEEETPSEKEEFEKKEELVSVNKYNQAIRKQREMELEKKELEKQLAVHGEVKEPVKPKKKEEKKEESFFDDVKDLDEEEDKKPTEPEKDPSEIVDEKLKPVMELLKKKEINERKQARTAFFEAHPEYLSDAEKWNGLLDELNESINPNSDSDYFQQLTKAHILFSGQNSDDSVIAESKKEMAGDASSSGDGAEKSTAKGEFTAEDRKIMKDFNISEDGYRAYQKKIKDGSMVLL